MKRINVEAIDVDSDGRVILNDDELIAIEKNFQVEPISGGENQGCGNGPCHGSDNSYCTNSQCGGNYNHGECVNGGANCTDLHHVQN